jgi:adenylate kinase family enzyme
MPSQEQFPRTTPPQRLLILGSPGSGKSTLARQLATRTRLPLLHLDQLYWHAGWVEPARAAWLEQLEAALAAPAWICDGNYATSLPLRLRYADAVLVLDYPTPLCLFRALKRVLTTRGTVRPDMAPGCPERFDPEFIRYILRFRRTQRPLMLAALQDFPGRVLWARTPRQLRALQGDFGFSLTGETSAPHPCP